MDERAHITQTDVSRLMRAKRQRKSCAASKFGSAVQRPTPAQSVTHYNIQHVTRNDAIASETKSSSCAPRTQMHLHRTRKRDSNHRRRKQNQPAEQTIFGVVET